MRIHKIVKIALEIVLMILGYLGISLLNIPVQILKWIISVILGYIIISFIILCSLKVKIKRYSKEIDKLLDKIMELKKFDTIDDEKKKEKKKKKKEKKEIQYEGKKEVRKSLRKDLRKACTNFKIAMAVLAIFIVANVKPIFVLAHEAIKTIEVLINDLGEKDEKNTSESEQQEASVSSESTEQEEQEEPKESASSGQEKQEKPISAESEELKESVLPESIESEKLNEQKRNWAIFILEYPERYPKISDDNFEKLYDSLFYINNEEMGEAIIEDIAIWISRCTPNTPLDNAVSKSGRSPQYYSNIEVQFFNENGENLSSRLMDEVIEGREELFDSNPNGTLAWMLANSYQAYALNYLKQSDDAKSILYLYMKSIENTQKSLDFNMSIESKIEKINYIKLRYKDIGDCEILDSEVRLKAYEIYTVIDNELYILIQENGTLNEPVG